jgi:hypothetical protein
MYGRRRRPLLGAALVMGTSSMVANRAVNSAQQKEAAARASQDLKRSEYERQQAEAKHKEEKADWENEKAEAKAKEERAAWEKEMAEDRKPISIQARREVGNDRRFCGNCGNGYALGTNFCSICGNKLT